MKKDLKGEKLLEEQLDNVQGGLSIPDFAVTTRCLVGGCGWQYSGAKETINAARAKHTREIGHNHFA